VSGPDDENVQLERLGVIRGHVVAARTTGT
jgi:hypothetical protein